MANNYMTQSLRELEAGSGQNLYNRMVQRGSRRAGANRERAIQAADDLLGTDPNVLQETLLKINDQAGSEFQGVEENATLAAAESAKELAKFKYQVGLQDQARKDQTTRDIAALGGGLLAAGTNIYGAKLGADALKSLMSDNVEGPPLITPPVPSLDALVPKITAPQETLDAPLGDIRPRDVPWRSPLYSLLNQPDEASAPAYTPPAPLPVETPAPTIEAPIVSAPPAPMVNSPLPVEQPLSLEEPRIESSRPPSLGVDLFNDNAESPIEPLPRYMYGQRMYLPETREEAVRQAAIDRNGPYSWAKDDRGTLRKYGLPLATTIAAGLVGANYGRKSSGGGASTPLMGITAGAAGGFLGVLGSEKIEDMIAGYKWDKKYKPTED